MVGIYTSQKLINVGWFIPVIPELESYRKRIVKNSWIVEAK